MKVVLYICMIQTDKFRLFTGGIYGEKDISEKILMDYNDVFADIINVCVFHGEDIVNPYDLVNTAVYSQYKAEDGRLHEEERDVAKYWKKKRTTIAMYGIENQSTIDKYMPFRIIGYDGAAYRSQLLQGKKKIVPVASFVLYFGTKRRWVKKKHIKDLMQMPEGLDEYVNDYKINVIEVAWLTEEQLKRFKSDFGIVANFFVQRRRKKNYIPDDEREFQHVDVVLKLLSVMTGDNSYEEILYDNRNGKKVEVKTMCEVAERLKKMGLLEGKEAGLREGKEAGLREERVRTIKKMLGKGLDMEKISDILELSLEEVKALAEK